jgi:hypothetical protein
MLRLERFSRPTAVSNTGLHNSTLGRDSRDYWTFWSRKSIVFGLITCLPNLFKEERTQFIGGKLCVCPDF